MHLKRNTLNLAHNTVTFAELRQQGEHKARLKGTHVGYFSSMNLRRMSNLFMTKMGLFRRFSLVNAVSTAHK